MTQNIFPLSLSQNKHEPIGRRQWAWTKRKVEPAQSSEQKLTWQNEWIMRTTEVGQSAEKEHVARGSPLDLRRVVPLCKFHQVLLTLSNCQQGLFYQRDPLGFKLQFSHTSGVVSEILSICCLHWFQRASVYGCEKSTFSALSWKCCSGSFRDDKLAQDGDLLKVLCLTALLRVVNSLHVPLKHNNE